jgi:hypothetical protein
MHKIQVGEFACQHHHPTLNHDESITGKLFARPIPPHSTNCTGAILEVLKKTP